MAYPGKKRQTSLPTQPQPAIDATIHWPDIHALVVGLGESGFACARWLIRKGARVTVIDTRSDPPMAQELRALYADNKNLKISTGIASPISVDFLSGVDMVVPSPGLSPHACHDGPAVQLLSQALEKNILVVGEIDLFEWAIHHAAHASSTALSGTELELPLELPKVLAITGTNGKTTTTQMTTALLRRAGLDAQEAGNISPSLLDAVMAREDESRFPQVWVLELSSFQLAIAKHFHPTAAAILNITEDHLDWHYDFKDYLQSKLRVFGIGIEPSEAGVQCIVNRSDSVLMQSLPKSIEPVTFGEDRPIRAEDFGLVQEGISWMCVRDPLDEDRIHRLMPADALRVRGRHNAMNALAALALCRAATPALAPLLHGLREFRGAAHRVQWVAQIRDVDFIDDSKGTNVGATVAALNGLGKRVVLIAGGIGKGQDFTPLREPISRHAQAVVLIGQDAPLIERAIAAAGVEMIHAKHMDEAVARAFSKATAGQAVLLSPACASFDMFESYVHRAQVFATEVQKLAVSEGVAC